MISAFECVCYSGLLFKWELVVLCWIILQVSLEAECGGLWSIEAKRVDSMVISVPQGSVFGPVLFLLYMKYLPDTLDNTLVECLDNLTLMAVLFETGKRVPIVSSLNCDLQELLTGANSIRTYSLEVLSYDEPAIFNFLQSM